ncbi:hypothetical protein KJ682_03235 [bacterium]|nr:hypothetical protein [bacterium]
MRNFATALLALLLLCPTIALAGAPLTGTWSSTDIGGTVPTGRYTEGWDAAGGAMLAGTTLNAASWDGAVLGASWAYSCAIETADAVLIDDSVIAGNGTRTWKKVFHGGTIWLSGSGPWSTGDPSYTGQILSYVEFETLTYVGGNVIGARTNVTATATIDGYDWACLGFTVGNGTKRGDTDSGPVLADYPDALTTSCSSGASNAAFWDFTQLVLYIDNCTVDTEAQTWSNLKALYR